MSGSRLSAYERLQRLRPAGPPVAPEDEDALDGPFGPPPLAGAPPEPPPGPPASALEGLERQLLGAPGEGLTLRERLQRLAEAAARRQPAPRPRAAALEELVQGQRIANERGEFFLIESEQPLESFHGALPLTRLGLASEESVRLLTGEPLFGFDLARAVFLDTETTGLAGGTGTAAFLIGVGFVDGDRFRVRQYFMRDYHEEPALLHALAAELARFEHVVTFNGKLFDLPLLETRFRLARARYPLKGAPHLDLLHPARRLWKARLESCRLQALEAGLLGLQRQGDVAGELIPGLYFDYVRSRDARRLLKVFDHNRTDIVSLAALAALACQWVAQGLAEEPLDLLSLGRVLERGAAHERSAAAYRRALSSAEPRVRRPALLRLAAQAARAGRFDEALPLWAEAAEAGEWRALRALAVHHEHRTRRLDEALAWVERGLACEAREWPGEAREDLLRRQRRLARRLAGVAR